MEQEDEGDDPQHDGDQDLAQLGEPLLERRRLALGALEHAGDPPQLGRHAGGDDDRVGLAGGDGRAQVDHVGPVAQRRRHVEHVLGVLGHGDRLPGQGGLLDAKVERPEEPGVGGDVVAALQDDPVAGHEVAGRDRLQPSFPEDLGQGGRESLEGRDRTFGPLLLDEADDAVQQHDGQDRQRVDHIAHQAGDQGGRDEDADDRLEELAEESPPPRRWLRLGELVRSVFLPTGFRFGLVEAALVGDAETGANLLHGQRMGRRQSSEMPMAMPMSAAFTAGASLTPSPVIATI